MPLRGIATGIGGLVTLDAGFVAAESLQKLSGLTPKGLGLPVDGLLQAPSDPK